MPQQNSTPAPIVATDLIEPIDQLAHIGHLIEALYMAAGDITERRIGDALQAVAVTAIARINEASDGLEELRAGAKGGAA